jgi:hypothetical protein
MKALAYVAAIAALTIIGCGSPEPAKTSGLTAPPTTTPAGLTIGDYELGAPIMAGNAAVIPVMYKDVAKQKGDEITLSEAKKLGLVEIIELPGDEDYRKLRVHNKSDRPLLLIGGELLLGGKQDRIVVHDVIIPPGLTQDVDVDCVEHDRWDGNTRHFDYSSKIVPSTVRDAAAYEGQDKVWESVGTVNKMSNGAPLEGGRSSTIQVTLNSPEVEKKVKEELPKLSKALEANSKAVGFIFVLNGEIRSMDLFGNPKTFQATRESLIHSLLAEAALTKGDGKMKSPSAEDYKTFVDDSINGKKQVIAGSAGFGMDVDGRMSMGKEVTSPGVTLDAPHTFVHGSYSKKK